MVHRVHFDMKWEYDFGHCIIVDMDIIQCTTTNWAVISGIKGLIKRVTCKKRGHLSGLFFSLAVAFTFSNVMLSMLGLLILISRLNSKVAVVPFNENLGSPFKPLNLTSGTLNNAASTPMMIARMMMRSKIIQKSQRAHRG